MKNIIRLLLIGFIAYSCGKSTDNFSKYKWILHYKTYDEDYNSTSHQRVLFRNDSAISYSELLSKEISFPLLKTDSTIVFKRHVTISEWGKSKSFPAKLFALTGKRDTIFIDTMFYDFKNIMDFPILAIKSAKYSGAPDIGGQGGHYITILTCTDKNATIQETNNFLNIISFKIEGYDIGDTISLDLLTDIEDCDDFDCEGIIEANLKQNKDIKLQVIDKKYIYSIEQSGIDEDAVDNIVKVVNQKLNMNPDTISKDPFFYSEGFRWETDELEIELRKRDMTQFYLDIAEKQKKTYAGLNMKYYYLTLAEKQIGHNDEFTLEYNNSILQTVLKYKQNKKAVSTIIE